LDNIEIYQYLLGSISEFLGKFVNEVSANAISELVPFVTISFMLVILWYSYRVMIGQAEQPVSYLVMKCLQP